jgi:predicted glutamine amidotransferase
MSSIIGVQEIDAFKWMLLFDTLRGEDATGVYIFGKSKKEHCGLGVLAKAVGRPEELYRKYPAIFNANGVVNRDLFSSINLIMGHNRAKTIGSNVPSNAHPFVCGNIVGTHNGTIATGLDSLPKLARKDSTDSEAIFNAMDKGAEFEEVLDKLTGAAAMVWFDKKHRTLNLYRNSERTLYYNYDKSRSNLLYSSEDWILNRSAFKAISSFVSASTKDTILVPENTLLSFTFNGHKLEKSNEKKIEGLRKRGAITGQHGYAGGDYYYKRVFNKSTEFDRRSTTTPPYLKKENQGELVVLHNNKVTPVRSSSGFLDMKGMTREAFNASTAKYGCSFCSCDLTYEENSLGQVHWIEKDAPLCDSCSKKELVNNVD